MKFLTVFEDIKIPTDYVSTQTFALLSRKDGGKTYTTLKFEEQMCDAGLFFVTLDPVGKHWALRAGPDGKPGGGKSDVWVLGGTHGDMPLDPDSGALIANTVVDHPGRYVLDVSTFESQSEQDRFATAFAKRLFRRKARDPGFPLMLIMEEAEDFIPQNVQQGQQQMKGAFSRIQKLGRNYGLGTWLVSQRSQNLDKGVLGQAEVLIAKQMSAKLDRDKVDDWVEANGTKEQRKELMDSLATLKQNEAWVWSPSWLGVFKRTTVPKRETFDSSASVKAGQRMKQVELVPLDIDALGEKMAEVADKAKSDDPKVLRKELEQVRGELNKAEGAVEDLAAAEEAVKELEAQVVELDQRPETTTVREVPVLREQDLQPLWELLDDVGPLVAAAKETRDLVRKAIDDGAQAIEREPEERQERPDPPPPRVEGLQPYQPPAPDPGPTAPVATPAREKKEIKDGELTKAQLELVETFVAFLPRSANSAQLGIVLAKSHNAGPFRGAINALRDAGYIESDDRGDFATAKAVNLVGHTSLPSVQDIQQRWRQRLKGSQQQILDIVIDTYPHTVSPEEVGQKIGKNHNAGPIRGIFNKLAALQLLTYDPQQGLRASDYLFKPTGSQ